MQLNAVSANKRVFRQRNPTLKINIFGDVLFHRRWFKFYRMVSTFEIREKLEKYCNRLEIFK